MLRLPTTMRCATAVAALSWAACQGSFGTAAAATIIVSDYGVAASAMPYAIAIKLGYFRDYGANVDAIVNLEGVYAIRRMSEQGIDYAEVSALGAASALHSGGPFKIVAGTVPVVWDYVWVGQEQTTIRSLKDFRGKRIAYSNAGTTTEALDRLLVAKAGSTTNETMLARVGGLPVEVTYLSLKAVDAAPLPEPLRTSSATQFPVVARAADMFPEVANAVVLTNRTNTKEQAAFVHAVLMGRQKAIDYIRTHPDDAARIIAEVYKVDPVAISHVIQDLLALEQARGAKFWSTGGATVAQMKTIESVMDATGTAANAPKWSDFIDDSLLPNAESSASSSP